MHFTNGRGHFRNGPHLFDDETVGQESLIDQLDDSIALSGPDGSIMTAANFHDRLECDQDPCKARAEISSVPFGHAQLQAPLLCRISRHCRFGGRVPRRRLVSPQEIAPATVPQSGMDLHRGPRRVARRVEPNSPVETALADVAKDTPIVTYC